MILSRKGSTKMKERIALWDNLKFLLIILVVLGHYAQNMRDGSLVFQNMYVSIYTFHMPVFIFVTGLFSKRAVNEKDTKKIFPFLTCFFVTSTVLFVTKYLMGWNVSLSLFSPGGLPWYLMSMFFMYLITMIVKDIKHSYIMVLSLAVGVMAGFATDGNPDLLTWLRTLIFYPFFYAGYITNQKKIVEIMKKWYYKVLSIIFFVAINVLICTFPKNALSLSKLLTGRHFYSELGWYADLGWLYRLLVYGIGFAACFLLISIIPKKKIFGISKFGQRTLGIYMFHYVFIYILVYVLHIQDNIKAILPAGWEYVFIPIAIATAYLCGNKAFDFISQKLFSTKWKLKEK